MLPLEVLAQEASDLAANLPTRSYTSNDASDQTQQKEGAQSKRVISITKEDATKGRQASAAVEEGARIMQICNACRYCEGFCAVFPAMTHRLAFSQNDIHFLSNLCHNCGACLHACQYAPPHEFGVNVPKAMAQVRLETYTTYAWPASFGKLYQKNGMALAWALVIGLALFIAIGVLNTGNLFNLFAPSTSANFYAVLPHAQLVGLFGVVFLYAILALGIGVRRFWRTEQAGEWSAGAAAETAHDVLSLKYLGGGHGEGCNDADDAFSLARRRFHHFTFYGFMLCFASTCVATIYDYAFGRTAPYPVFSLPVILGLLGGIGLIVGPAGLLYLNLIRHPLQGDARQKPMDRAFILLLLLVSATGLALLGFRSTSAMGVMLVIHLGAVMALFLTLPYGKFAHGIFRTAALMKWSIEKRHPPKLNIGAD